MFAYIIMSYEDPDLVCELASRLKVSSPDAIVVVRHDARRTPPPENLPSDVVVHESHARVAWGDWSLVQASLDEMDFVRRTTNATHFVLISGKDYPVRPLTDWEKEVAAYDAVFRWEELSFKPRWGRRRGYVGNEQAIRHLYRWYAIPGTSRCRPGSRMIRWANYLASHVRPIAYVRLLPRGRGVAVGLRAPWRGPAVYKGSTWLMLSARAVDAVLTSPYRPAFRRSLIPEESYIHTVVLNNAASKILDDYLTFTKWDAHALHPRLLKTTDLDDILASGCPFARKVEDVALRRELDKHNAPAA